MRTVLQQNPSSQILVFVTMPPRSHFAIVQLHSSCSCTSLTVQIFSAVSPRTFFHSDNHFLILVAKNLFHRHEKQKKKDHHLLKRSINLVLPYERNQSRTEQSTGKNWGGLKKDSSWMRPLAVVLLRM